MLAEVVQLHQEHRLTCSKCKELLPANKFSKRSDRKRGYMSACRSCENKKQYRRYRDVGKVWRETHTHSVCTKCKLDKPVSEFFNNDRRKCGIESSCKECQRPERKINRENFWKKNGRDKYKTDTWGFKKHYYGITKEQFYQKLSDQSGCCAICRRLPNGEVWKVFHVDHNHETGLVRGLLCGHCNRGLGQFRDSILAIKNAADYLQKWGCYGKA